MFGLNQTELFNDSHRIVLARELQHLKRKHPKVFSRIADISEVELYWNHSFDTDNGHLGCFRWYAPGGIELSTVFRSENSQTGEYDMSMKQVIPVICHELHHKYQLSNTPVKYFVGLFVRSLIENSADKIEKEVTEIMDKDL